MDWFQLQFDQHLAPESGKNKISSFWRWNKPLLQCLPRKTPHEGLRLLPNSSCSAATTPHCLSFLKSRHPPIAALQEPSHHIPLMPVRSWVSSNSFPVFQQLAEKLEKTNDCLERLEFLPLILWNLHSGGNVPSDGKSWAVRQETSSWLSQTLGDCPPVIPNTGRECLP